MIGLAFILLGPPGAGKGIQGLRLAERLRAHFFSAGDLLRAAVTAGGALGQQLEPILDAGGVVPSDLLMPILEKAVASIADNRPIIFDFAGTREQCIALDEMLARYDRKICAVFLIYVPREELRTRLIARVRADDKPELIEERFAIYEREIVSVRAYYEERNLLHVVDGNGTPEEVTDRLLAHMEGVRLEDSR
jgi:adenylate kinase